MTSKLTRRPRADVARALFEVSVLWSKPPPTRGTAPVPAGTEAADLESSETPKAYAPDPRRARGRS